ncbi:MAG: FliH/SctL family protein [Alphaproteobacteria bacterium]|nr:FliH/SctL family protein [Alphaproteobacteria bacterium]
MANFKRFMFDNFIVGEKEEEAFADDSSLEQESFAGDQVEEPSFQPEEEDVAPEFVREPAPMVNEAQQEAFQTLAKEIEQAREDGYEKGFTACRESTEAQQVELLQNLGKELKEIFSQIEKKTEAFEKNSVGVLVEALQKLVPSLLTEKAEEIVANFMKENFANIKNEPKLSFYIHPGIASAVQKEIVELARVNDFEGKISIHKDETLGLADCRIEWDNGGVERKSEEVLKKVEAFFVD